MQATAAPPSSEHVVLDTVPPVDHPNDALVAVVEVAGALVSETVGRTAVLPDVIVQLCDRLALPALFETVTRKV